MNKPFITKREMQVIERTALGLLAKEIGAELGISRRTVDAHRYNLYKKLGVSNTVELANYYYREIDNEPESTDR